MTIAIANVITASDSFGQWIEKSNKGFYALSYKTVTTDSNTTVGSAGITGTFFSDSIFANASLKIGYASSNVVMSNTNIVINSGTASNTSYSSNGMILNNLVLYTSSIMRLGSSIITTTNVTSGYGYFTSNVVVGNTTLYRNYIQSDGSNTGFLKSLSYTTTGDVEANVYMNRYGLQIYDNPTGVLVQNSKMTSTDLWIKNIHSSGTIYAKDINYTGAVTFGTSGGGGVTGDSSTFYDSAFFAKGLISNGNIGIRVGGNRTGITPVAPIHIIKDATSISAIKPNSDSLIVLETSTSDTFIEFHYSQNRGTKSGLVFVDDNQAGYVIYDNSSVSLPGSPVNDRADCLRLGAWTGINFEVSNFVSTGTTGIYKKPRIAQLNAGGLWVNGCIQAWNLNSETGVRSPDYPDYGGLFQLSLPRTNSQLVGAAAPGGPFVNIDVYQNRLRFYESGGTNRGGYIDLTTLAPGAGSNLAAAAASAAITDSNLKLKSLGVGTDASGVTGEIRATNDITAFYSSDISLKTNIKNIDNAMDKIQKINGVYFDWTDSHLIEHGGEDDYFNRKHDVGVIAQEIETVLPEVVATREDGIKAVKYDRIVALLIEGIKELKEEINELKNNGCKCGCK
jgi:hypothetical protein